MVPTKYYLDVTEARDSEGSWRCVSIVPCRPPRWCFSGWAWQARCGTVESTVWHLQMTKVVAPHSSLLLLPLPAAHFRARASVNNQDSKTHRSSVKFRPQGLMPSFTRTGQCCARSDHLSDCMAWHDSCHQQPLPGATCNFEASIWADLFDPGQIAGHCSNNFLGIAITPSIDEPSAPCSTGKLHLGSLGYSPRHLARSALTIRLKPNCARCHSWTWPRHSLIKCRHARSGVWRTSATLNHSNASHDARAVGSCSGYCSPR